MMTVWSPLFSHIKFFLLQFSEYEVVAKGYGGTGFTLDRSNEDKMEELLKQAQKDAKDGKSVLINALIGKTDFRDGSLAV